MSDNTVMHNDMLKDIIFAYNFAQDSSWDPLDDFMSTAFTSRGIYLNIYAFLLNYGFSSILHLGLSYLVGSS